jgi:hypothetical protein
VTRAKTWSSPLIIPTSTCTCRRSETVNELGNHISMLIKNNCAQYLRSYLWLYNQKTKLWIISVTSVEATLIFKICVYSAVDERNHRQLPLPTMLTSTRWIRAIGGGDEKRDLCSERCWILAVCLSSSRNLTQYMRIYRHNVFSQFHLNIPVSKILVTTPY